MKKGDVIYCKKNVYFSSDSIELIKGKKYIVIDDISPQPFVKVINEYEHFIWCGTNLFTNLKEIRKQKLKKILK
jgi:hypothetical protein